jgi:AcrR family transcriptional regulator
MTRNTSDTRSRMIQGAALLVGSHGAKSASLRDLARQADVPLGSTYHHFPGGKQQLVDEAVQSVGARIDRMIARTRDDGPEAVLRAFADGWRAVLESSEFTTGCPVMAVALEDDPTLRATANGIFELWQQRLTETLRDAGLSAERAPRLARTVVAAVEGALALCRAERSITPLEDVVAELRSMLIDAGKSANSAG